MTGWMNRALALAVLVTLPLLTTAQALPMRLSEDVVPLSYRLALTVDPAQPRHHGEVLIAVDIKAATRAIRLHAKALAVSSATLEMAGRSYAAKTNALGEQLIELAFAEQIAPGRGQLRLVFAGQVDDKGSQGLFRQKERGRWYAFTQFEASDARRAFPVFDEPRWKVPWTLALTVPQQLTAVANTAVAREVPLAKGMKRVEFLTTRPLPSYLVAFGVGPFDVLDGGKVGSTPLRYITPHGRAQEARYAASVTPAILAALENYFGHSYPYDKLDVMALPITLNFGAMENPGLVTFASRLVLASPAEETLNFKRSYVAVQAHELAHQWFGNYVTMAWWDDLWLNESFASWMGDKITAGLMPDWHFETGTQQARARAMRADRLASARRIHQPVNDEASLAGAFDGITYSKGQAVLAMFESWLGAEAFQAGVRRYMLKHAWGNAAGDDFVSAVTAGDTELAGAIRSFTEQPGIPRLKVAIVCDGKPVLHVSQSRFLPAGSTASQDSTWQIPLRVRTPGGLTRLLLTRVQDDLPLPDQGCPPWVETNVDGMGYYRSVYAPGQLTALLQRPDLSVGELLADLDDAQALTESGDISAAEALALAERYASHPRREVVDAALGIIGRMQPLIGSEQRSAYAAVWQRAFGERGRALGLTGKATDSDDERLIRERWLVRLVDAGGDPDLRLQARKLTHAWLRDRSVLAVADRPLVLRSAAIEGDRALFDALVAAALTSNNRRERADIYAALGHFEAPELAQAARALWLSPKHDVRELLVAGRDRNSLDPVREGWFDFVRQNFVAMSRRLPEESVARFPQFFAGFCASDKVGEVERFFAPRLEAVPGGTTHLRQALESIRLCAAYRALQKDSLSDFLAGR